LRRYFLRPHHQTLHPAQASEERRAAA